MKKLLCLLGGALLVLNGQGQTYGKLLLPLYIDESLPDITFSQIINYKDSVAKLSDFQGPEKKLVIFDFWNLHCSVCIAQFPKEDSLQRLYKKDVQFIMVTQDPKQKAKDFIALWEKSHHKKLDIPVVVDDTLLTRKYIRVLYEPQFGWIDRWNRLVAQTNEYFLTAQNIENTLKAIKADREEMEKAANADAN